MDELAQLRAEVAHLRAQMQEWNGDLPMAGADGEPEPEGTPDEDLACNWDSVLENVLQEPATPDGSVLSTLLALPPPLSTISKLSKEGPHFKGHHPPHHHASTQLTAPFSMHKQSRRLQCKT